MQVNKLRNSLGLLFAAVVFMAIAGGVVWGADRLIADAARVAHTVEVIGQLDEAEARVREAEASQRGYILTDNASYLADYSNAVQALPPLQRRLADLVSDNPEQLRRARSLLVLVTSRVQQLEQTLERYNLDGLPAAQASIDGEVLAMSGAIRQQVKDMREAERVLLEARAASTANSGLLLRALAVLGIPFGLLAIVIGYLMLVREIRQRARAEIQVAEANRELTAGFDKLERSGDDLRALTHYGSMLQSCREPSEAFELTERMLKHLLPGTAGTVYRMRDSQDHTEALASWGEHRTSAPEVLDPGACWALRRGQAHRVTDARDTRCVHADSARHAHAGSACVPLSAQGVQLGLLYLSGDDARFLDRMDIISAVAEQLSMALSNLYLQERLRLQSIREPLTGLFNRRYLEESASREFARCARRLQPVSLLMLDIDHFKRFNDVHGHAGGDAVLAEFGKLLQGLARPEDIACRYGGEEFTIIMPEAAPETARQRAEAIRVAVEGMRVTHQGGTLPPLTVSIGIASFPGEGYTAEAVLRAADEALYRAKRAGRNRVEHAGRSPAGGITERGPDPGVSGRSRPHHPT
ncbi:MAG TPA: diguanylate cyclase [Pseudoxanthomonas sp.]|nr:diguanylate cyclase [Pseudoxanthomonas sp.]